MKPRIPNRFLSALLVASGFAFSLSSSFAAIATKAGTGTDLNDAASWSGGSGPGFPTSADTATWASTSLGAGLTLGSNGSWGGISVTGALSDIDISGAGTLTLGTTGLAVSSVNLAASCPLTLGGAQTWNVASGKLFTASGTVARGSNTLSINTGTGASAITGDTTGTGTLNVLNGSLSLSGTSSALGQVNVGNTNSSSITPVLNISAGTTTMGRLNFGGTGARGVMNISGTATATVSGDFVMFGGNGTSNTTGSGVINQSGGTFTINPGVLMAWSGNAYGAYQLSGGVLNQGNSSASNTWEINNQNSTAGLFSQTGGTANLTSGFRINGNAGSTVIGVLDVSGGTFTHKTTGNFMATTGGAGGVLTVRGSGTISEQTGNFFVTNGASGKGFVNLLSGGTLEINKIQKTTGTATLNADGGTLKPYTTNGGASFLTGLDNMFLYPGGLTFDSAGQSVTIGQAMVAPTGYGVGSSGSSISVSSGGTGYIAPPVVAFAAPASGVAATGVAVINSSGTVTQIIITSPGSGYTSGQSVAVTFNGGNNSANAATSVATPPTVTASTLNASGGLTKIGSGTLTLNATGTYTGATTINAGTLALGASGVLGSASNVSLAAGATLDVSGLGASATYTLGSDATLTASGTGTTVGTNAATITGGASGTVSLGSRPVTLNWSGAASGTDSTHPALTVSQGTLSLSNNQFTVVSGSALGVGTYTLATAPAITGTVNATPLFTGGSGLGSGLVGAVSISGSNVILTVSASAPVVSASGTLTALSTTYGTPSGETSFTISGSDLVAGILVQPPVGYEVSTTSGSGFSGSGVSMTVGSPPTVSSTTIYVRLAANAQVGGTFDAQNITISSPSATPVNVVTATGNSVSAKNLTIDSAAANSKMHDGNTSGTVTGTLQPAEAFGTGSSADGKPYTGDVLTVTAPGTFASSAVGTGIPVTAGTFILDGAAAGNYTLTQPTGLSLSADILNTAVWTNTAGGSWPVVGNWQNNIVGTGANNTADFSTLSLPANAIVTLDGARTIGNLVFDDQNATKHSWTVNPNVTGDLTLAVDSGSPVIANNVQATLNTVIAGTQGLIKAGTGTLTLGAANSYTGGTLLRRGTLALNHGNALNTGAGTLTLGDASTGSNPVEFKLDTGITSASTLASITNSNFGTDQIITINAGSALAVNAAAIVTTLDLSGTVPVTLKATNTGSHGTAQDMNWRITGSGIPAGSTALILDGTLAGLRTSQLSNTSAASNFTGDVVIKGNVVTQNRTYAGTGATNQNLGFLNNDITVNTGSTWTLVWGGETCGALNGSGSIVLNNQAGALNNIGLTLGNNDRNGSFSGGISGSFGVAKTGTGTQTFASANTYSGTTTVNNGKLLVTNTTGSGTGTGAVTVNANGTLGGTGTVSGAVTVNANGSVAPGSTGTGTLTTGAATISGTYACQIDGADSDKIASTGSLTLTNATLAISTINAPTATSYVIATFTGATPSFTTVTGLPAGYSVDTTSTSGQIKLVKGGYGSWASTNAPSGTPTDDYDGDGVNNALEWILGGLASTNDQGKLPTASTTGGNLVFTFVRNDEAWQSGDTTTQIQVGTTLASWPNVYNVGIDTATSSPEVTITDNGTTDTVTLSVPMGADAKKFARLQTTVTVTP